MIIGIGTDIIEIARIEKALEGGFLEKFFTGKEIEFFSRHRMKPEKIAGNFCAKEALAKALGTGFAGGVWPLEIETLRDDKGAPFVVLYGKTKEAADSIGVKNIHISISHSRDNAIAYIVLEGE